MVPVFASVGRIYELRLMIEFSGTNRTYCYVRFHAMFFTRPLPIADFAWKLGIFYGIQSISSTDTRVSVVLILSECKESSQLVTRYCNENDAKEAVRKLHNYRIRLVYHFP